MKTQIMLRIFLFLTGLFSLGSPVQAADLEKSLRSPVINSKGEVIGQLDLKQASNGVLLNLSIQADSLAPGFHGMHFHKMAHCNHESGFKTAQGHIDPKNKPHGFLNEKGPHEGNLPNLIVAKDGSAQVELYSSLVSLDEGEAKLLDEDGSALIIHKNQDDHVSQPIGGSGGRIACAKIKKE